MVERCLAKADIAGPNPVSRSIFLWHHGQVVRRGSAKPLFLSSNLSGASKRVANATLYVKAEVAEWQTQGI